MRKVGDKNFEKLLQEKADNNRVEKARKQVYFEERYNKNINKYYDTLNHERKKIGKERNSMMFKGLALLMFVLFVIVIVLAATYEPFFLFIRDMLYGLKNS